MVKPIGSRPSLAGSGRWVHLKLSSNRIAIGSVASDSHLLTVAAWTVIMIADRPCLVSNIQLRRLPAALLLALALVAASMSTVTIDSEPAEAQAAGFDQVGDRMKADFRRWHQQVWGSSPSAAWQDGKLQLAINGWCVDNTGVVARDYFTLPWVVTQMGGISNRLDVLYRSVLNRPPDAGGLAFWQSQFANGVSWSSIVSSITQGIEAKARYRQICPSEFNFTTGSAKYWGYWAESVAFNGERVYLSAPRHPDEIGRRGCGYPSNGYKENVNGYQLNRHSAQSYYNVGTPPTGFSWSRADLGSNLGRRGYAIQMSPNSHVSSMGWKLNRTAAQNWPADVVIVSHTNGIGSGCQNGSNPTNYFLVLHRDNYPDSIDLSNRLLNNLGPYAPGPGQSFIDRNENESFAGSCCGEFTTSTQSVAYIEMAFHTNSSGNDWLRKQSRRFATLYGLSVDQHLGYP